VADEWISRTHVDLWEPAPVRLLEAYAVEAAPHWRLELDHQPYGEIWLVRDGRCAVTLGDEHALAGPGEVVVLRPDRRRVSANGASGPLALAGFGFSLPGLAEIELPLVIRQPSERLRELIEQTVQAAHGDRVDRALRARASAELVLAEIVPAELPARELRPEVQAALAHIDAHFGEPLDLAALAAAVHLSPKHLSRLFRDALGIAPIAYLRRHRLHWAREQLLSTDAPVTTIGLEAGFKDTAHFSRAFRAEHGVSPRALRSTTRSLRASVPASAAVRSSP
jgi:AraC-like DNA-binding protein